MVRRKVLSELEKAEIKLQSLIEKRTARNEEANVLRQERDLVHGRKREVGAELRELKKERSALTAEARAHREVRDELQAKAKSLIEVKRKLRGRAHTSVAEEVRALRRRVEEMELRQQTASLSLRDENKLLGAMKAAIARLKELEVLKAEEDQVAKEVRDLDAEITSLFNRADHKHAAAKAVSDRARSLDGRIDEFAATVAALAREGDAKHEAYLAAKAKADEVHAQIVEMRQKVLSVRATRRAERIEARDLLRQQNVAVRRALQDKKKLEETADEALKRLLERGRVEIR